jgi:hypothetical protein
MKYTRLFYPEYPLDLLDNNKVRILDRILGGNRRRRSREYNSAWGIAESIKLEGLHNPLTIEWFSVYPNEPPTWSVRDGNNRWLALTHFLKRETAPCLFFVLADREPPPGEYKNLGGCNEIKDVR